MKIIVTLIAMVFSTVVFTQDFQGVATYRSHRKMNMKIDDENKNSAIHKELRAQLAKQFEKEYTLIFTKSESTFKENESLSSPVPSSSGITITVSGSNDVYYKNIKDKRYTKATKIFEKPFLIKDSLQTRKWKLLADTKIIGEYLCRKAVFKDTYKTQTITDNGNIETIEKQRETVAWFTLQIPVSHGPFDFFGLPGLILEVNDGELTLLCAKIVINPKETVEIKEPKRGKEITQNKFDAIQKKKTEESIKQFQIRGKNGSSSSIFIGG